MDPTLIVIAVALVSVGTVVLAALYARSLYRRVGPDQALILNKIHAEPTVSLTGMLVLPILHRAEVLDLSVHTIQVEQRASTGIICQDHFKVDLQASLRVKVPRDHDAIVEVAQTIGCASATDPERLRELFAAKFSTALIVAVQKSGLDELLNHPEDIESAVIVGLGHDHCGFDLVDVSIEGVALTPIEHLDPTNILDFQAIRQLKARGETG